jgi:hypothetical protein
MSCTQHQFKRGVTFNGAGTYTPEDGWPASLTGVTIVTALRDARNQLHYFDVAITSPTTFTVSSNQTQEWHPGTAYWDIQFFQNTTEVFYSATVRIEILPNVTPNKVSNS